MFLQIALKLDKLLDIDVVCLIVLIVFCIVFTFPFVWNYKKKMVNKTVIILYTQHCVRKNTIYVQDSNWKKSGWSTQFFNIQKNHASISCLKIRHLLLSCVLLFLKCGLLHNIRVHLIVKCTCLCHFLIHLGEMVRNPCAKYDHL